MDVVGRPELKADARFATRDVRVRNYAVLERELAQVFSSKDRLHWMAKLERADVPFAPIQTVAEVLDDPQVKHLGTFYGEDHPAEGHLTLIRRPVLIDGRREVASRPPPTLGEHTSDILAELSEMAQTPSKD